MTTTTFFTYAELSFTDVTPGMIDHFHIWLQAGGSLKINSINSYLSSLRAIYNTAVREGLAPADRLSPFVHLILRAEETAKRALRIDTLEEIARMDVSDDPNLQQAKDFGLFSFLACGMPFVDLAHLVCFPTYLGDGGSAQRYPGSGHQLDYRLYYR